MSEIQGDGPTDLYIPDDLTISQFILDTQHPARPVLTGAHPWLIEEATGRQIGSDELRARVHGLTNALKIRWNVGEDDVVCLFTPNHVDYVVAIWAAHRLGGIVATSNPMYNAEELTYQLKMTKTKVLVAHSSTLPVAIEAAHLVGLPEDHIILIDSSPNSSYPNVPDLVRFGLREKPQYTERRLKSGEARAKVALLLFSSGTTGKPKAVMMSHYSLVANLVQMLSYLRLTDDSIPMAQKRYRPGSVGLLILPLFHAYGLHMVLFGSMVFGSTLVISARFQLERMLQSIQQYRVTHLYLVPPHAVLLCKSSIVQKYDLSSVQVLGIGAAPVSAELTEGLVKLLPHCVIGQGYGMTEVTTMVAYLQLDKQVGTLGCAGILLPGITARVVRPDGTLAALGELGELHVKGPSLTMGYLDNAAATEESFQDGWLRTGDEVRINEHKEIFVVDRIKEFIKVRGFQVAPSELEGHLLDHPDVGDACVVGVPDEYSGEKPFAFVVLSADAEARNRKNPESRRLVKELIMKHVSEHKSRFKWLAGVYFIDSMPRTQSGKLLRRVLREQAKVMVANGEIALPSRAKL
ncbi:acetyl-CoA synthetase-like protein [Fomes fomentarius]|nr:acetyl-CoA synthetase-like protein [Fomes fomentarius]